MYEINLDLVIEFAKTVHLDVDAYSDPAIKANPSRYVYNIVDNNLTDPTPSKYYLDVNCLSLTFVHAKTKNIMIFNKQWREFLINKNIAYADSILEEIEHNIRFVNNNIYKISSSENAKIRSQKIEALKLIKQETLDFLDNFSKTL